MRSSILWRQTQFGSMHATTLHNVILSNSLLADVMTWNSTALNASNIMEVNPVVGLEGVPWVPWNIPPFERVSFVFTTKQLIIGLG